GHIRGSDAGSRGPARPRTRGAHGFCRAHLADALQSDRRRSWRPLSGLSTRRRRTCQGASPRRPERRLFLLVEMRKMKGTAMTITRIGTALVLGLLVAGPARAELRHV